MNSLICFCNSNFSTSALMLSSVSGDTTPQTASKLHRNTIDHTSVTAGTNYCYEITSTHLHKRKQIIQKFKLYFSLCAATNPCRFELLTKCSQGITLLVHSLCCSSCKFSPYLCNMLLHSALELQLLCLFVIFRSSFF